MPLRDEAATARSEVGRYSGASFTAEREGEDLVIYSTQPIADDGESFPAGMSVRDRATQGALAGINRANRARNWDWKERFR
jgi:hypothetical protein